MPTDKQRREVERRRQQRQNRRRYQRYQRRRRVLLAGTVLGVLALVALAITFVVVTNGEDTPAATRTSTTPSASTTLSGSPSDSASSTAAALPRYPCTFTKSGTSAKSGIVAPTDTTPARTGKVTVSVATNRGKMTFTLNRAVAPCAVESFVTLAKQGYYNSTPCHRLVTANIYVLQCGDPLGTGAGGPGYTVNDEGTDKETYLAGSIAMARTQDANSTGSQFFIVYKDSPDLRRGLGLQQYTEFGTVTSGIGVVEKVAAAGAATAGDGKSKLPVTITKMSTPSG